MSGTDSDFRWTAVLSADMVDFTATARRIGPEQSYALLNHVLTLAAQVIESEGGHIVDTAGDGILAAFGAPRALENAALRCCRAAHLILQRLAAERAAMIAMFEVAPQFRIGLSGGQALVARSGSDSFKLVGDPVQEAARLQAHCAPSEALLSDAVARETAGFIRTTDRGMLEVKGFESPIHANRLDGLVEAATRFEGQLTRGLSALVSREAELGATWAALEKGDQIALIAGPPGVGKSRLMHEIVTRDAPARKAYIGQCTPGGRTLAYAPILDILRQASGARWGASRTDIIGAFFERHPDLPDRAAAVQFLEPVVHRQDQGDRALADRAFLLSLLQGLVEREGCILGLEDVHWIDASTQALVATAVERRLPMLITTRPEAQSDWMGEPNVTRIDLSPLTTGGIRSVAEGCLDASISDVLAQLISDKAEGIPLIAEELARALSQENRLTRGPEGLDLIEPGETLLTGNLEQLVLSRFDRISAEQKAALQMAAAIGRDFSTALLDAALDGPSNLSEIPPASGLVEPVDETHWRFSHALIRDAVYASLLSAQRHAVHDQIAEALLVGVGGAIEGQAGVLADHLLLTARPERAVPHLIDAAIESLGAYALYDVDQRLEQAMGFLETDPALVDDERFGDLSVAWLRALDQIGDFGRILRVTERVMPRLSRRGYSPQLAIVRTLTAIAMTHARDYRGAEELALATLDAAESEDDHWGGAWAKVALMRIYDETGWKGHETLERLAEEIEPVADATGDRHLGMTALYLLSSGYRSAGFRIRALDVAARIEAFSERYNDRRAAAYAIWARSIVHAVESNPELSHKTVAPALKSAVQGQADERVSAGINLFAQVYLSPPDEVRPKLERMIAEGRALQDFNIAHSMEWTRAILEIKAGHLALGWRLLSELEGEVLAAGNQNLVRQVYVSKGEILLAIAGLVDPDSEAPDERPQFPRSRPGLADIALGVRLRLRAKALAAQAMQTCLSLERANRGAHFARCQIGLGLIAASKGQREAAAEHLKTGLASAQAEQLGLLVRRAEKGLHDLG